MEITGKHLKIQGNLDEEGVFFVNQTEDSEAKAEQIRRPFHQTGTGNFTTLKYPASLS